MKLLPAAAVLWSLAIPGRAAAPEAPSRFPTCDPAAKEQRLTFIHATDMHAGYGLEPGGESPYARVRGWYERTRAENPFTFFLDGGDQFEKGSVAETLSEGRTTLEAARAMCFDVRVLGNHDFAFGWERLLEFSRDPCAVTLAGNMRAEGPDRERFGAVDFVRFKAGCLKVGFFGMVVHPWNEINEPFPGRYYPGLVSRYDFVARAREIVRAHRQEVAVLVMLSHLGTEFDTEIALQVPGIDLILSGHTHDVHWRSRRVGGSVLINSGMYGRYFSQIDLTYDLVRASITSCGGGLRTNMPGQVPPDERVSRAIADILAPYAAAAAEKVATVKEARDEGAIAEVVARAARVVLKADAAFCDKGSVWKTWAAGPVSLQDLAGTLPIERQPPGTPGFSGYYRLTVTGAQLARLRSRLDPAIFAYAGPDRLEPSRRYSLALQKKEALHPEVHFKGPVRPGPAAFADEAWSLLAAYARLRRDVCRYLDADEDVPACRTP